MGINFNTRQKKVVNATDSKILCLAAPAAGKALPNSEKIPTPLGWKTVGEIQVGDYLFDADGHPTKVLQIFPQGKKKVYEITFRDGRVARCSKDHIWYVHKTTWREKEQYKEYTLGQIIQEGYLTNSNRMKFFIPQNKAAEYEEKPFKIHPYVIGAFLGDGCCTLPYLTISSENEEIPNRIKELINCDEIYKNPANFNWTFKNKGKLIKTKDVLPKELCDVCYNKRVPIEYKYGSIDQRIKLIQGLMDTDGSIYKDKRETHKNTATVSFTSTSPLLIDDVREILWSLGYESSVYEDKRITKYTTGQCFQLNINISNEEKIKLFSLKRKKDIAESVKDLKSNHIYNRVGIKSIKALDYEEEMTCFLVDNDKHLFLTSNYIVTHNTRVITERVKFIVEQLKVDPSKIVAISFTNLAAEEMKRRLGESSNGIFIGTIHSYANQVCLSNKISTHEYLLQEKFDKIIETAIKIPWSKYPPVEHLLVDECQDLSPLEAQFLSRIPAKNTFWCGDDRQQIYGFRGTSDEFLYNMWKNDDYKKYYLTENYRNAPNIIKFAENMLKGTQALSPPSSPHKTKLGILEEHIGFFDALDELEWSGLWKDWFILCRTNNEIVEVQKILNDRGIPNISFKKGDLNPEEVDQLLESDAVKVLTCHSAKGLERKYVIVVGARMYNEEERKISYVAATRAMDALYWCPSIIKRGRGAKPNYKKKNNFGEDVITF